MAQLVVPAEVAPWVVSSKAHEVQDGPDGMRRLVMLGRGKRTIEIPGPFDPSTFNQVAVSGVFPFTHKVTLTLWRDDGKHFAAGTKASVNHPGVQEVLFDMPRLGHQPRPFDGLRLEIAGPEPRFELVSVGLLHQPLARKLADPEGPPSVVHIAGESRPAVGLLTGDPVFAEFDVRQAGEELLFSFGQLESLRSPDQQLALRVRVEGEAGEKSQRFVLEPEAEDRPRWHDARMPLDSFVGGRVRAHFELEATPPAVCALGDVVVSRVGEDAPTILMITSDTHRADYLGVAHLGVEIATPVIDSLAERGVLFEDCYATTNVTSPSHVAIMTAIHPRDTRVTSNQGFMGEAAWTLAEAFRESGYMTLGVASVRHLGPLGTGLGQGFDRMAAPTKDTFTAEQAIDILEGWLPDAEGRPLFVWLHVFDAHHPYAPPPDFDRRYYPADRDPFEGPDPPLANMPEDLQGLRDLEFPIAQYKAEVSYLDHELGRILDRPRFRDGIVAFTGDHGEILAMDGTYFNHSELYPVTLHVPLLLAWPGAPAGGVRISEPVEQIHLARTLLDLAGLEQVPFPGASLGRYLDEHRPPPAPRFALAAHANSASVTYDGWHYLLHLRKHKGPLREERAEHASELYDIREDPECLEDLSESMPEQAARLRASLVRWLADLKESGFAGQTNLTPEAIQQLHALGYATDGEAADGELFDPQCECEECSKFRE